MNNVKKILFLIFLFYLLNPALQSFAQNTDNADAIIGKWFTADNKSIVQIYKNSDNKYYGKIIWLKEPNFEGKPKIDNNNPDKNLRNNPRIGLVVLKDMKYEEENHWSGGTVYDPENGKTYESKMVLTNTNRLDLRGYIGISLIGRTTVWMRAKL